MAYNKTTWIDDVTPLDAEHLNNMEDGIEKMYKATINGKALSDNPSLTATDVGALSDSTEIPIVDQTYSSTSENAQSGTAVAEALQALCKEYELIETITLTEDVQQISRTSEPNGAAYNFKKLFISYKGKNMSRFRAFGNYKYGNTNYEYNCYIVANHTHGYLEIDASDVLKYYGAGGAGTAYTTQWCTTGAYANIQKADCITSFRIEGTSSLYAGTVINIYGVRA